MKDNINQKIQGNDNNVIGSNGSINIHRSPVSVRTHYIYQTSDVEIDKINDEIDYYLSNGWELINQYQHPNLVKRRGKSLLLTRLEFRKEVLG